MGAKAYRILEDLLNLSEIGTDKKVMEGDIVEIGSERGDGSTEHIQKVAKKYSLNFYTVDYEKEAYELVRDKLGMKKNAFQMTGEHFLENVYSELDSSTGKICFAYLDNFDYAFPELVSHGKDFLEKQKKVYEEYDIEYNNENSKKAHLEQAKLIHKYASNPCFILFDDTYFEVDGSYGGKGGYAIPWLEENGWKRVNAGGEFKREKDDYSSDYMRWKLAQVKCWFLLTNMIEEVIVEKK